MGLIVLWYSVVCSSRVLCLEEAVCVLIRLGMVVVVLESFLFAGFGSGLRGGCISVPERGMEAAQRSLRFQCGVARVGERGWGW